MPAWGAVIGEDGVKNVAAYVRQELAGLKLPEGTQVDLEAGKQRSPPPAWLATVRKARVWPCSAHPT